MAAINHAAIMRASIRVRGADSVENNSKDSDETSSIRSQVKSLKLDGKVNEPIQSLDRVTNPEEINYFLDPEFHYDNALSRINSEWLKLTEDFHKICDHLNESSQKVTLSSAQCLEALNGSINNMCDELDEGIKASYRLLANCDKIKQEMGVISQFADSVKQLKKTIETLEYLYLTTRSQSSLK